MAKLLLVIGMLWVRMSWGAGLEGKGMLSERFKVSEEDRKEGYWSIVPEFGIGASEREFLLMWRDEYPPTNHLFVRISFDGQVLEPAEAVQLKRGPFPGVAPERLFQQHRSGRSMYVHGGGMPAFFFEPGTKPLEFDELILDATLWGVGYRLLTAVNNEVFFLGGGATQWGGYLLFRPGGEVSAMVRLRQAIHQVFPLGSHHFVRWDAGGANYPSGSLVDAQGTLWFPEGLFPGSGSVTKGAAKRDKYLLSRGGDLWVVGTDGVVLEVNPQRLGALSTELRATGGELIGSDEAWWAVSNGRITRVGEGPGGYEVERREYTVRPGLKTAIAPGGEILQAWGSGTNIFFQTWLWPARTSAVQQVRWRMPQLYPTVAGSREGFVVLWSTQEGAQQNGIWLRRLGFGEKEQSGGAVRLGRSHASAFWQRTVTNGAVAAGGKFYVLAHTTNELGTLGTYYVLTGTNVTRGPAEMNTNLTLQHYLMNWQEQPVLVVHESVRNTTLRVMDEELNMVQQHTFEVNYTNVFATREAVYGVEIGTRSAALQQLLPESHRRVPLPVPPFTVNVRERKFATVGETIYVVWQEQVETNYIRHLKYARIPPGKDTPEPEKTLMALRGTNQFEVAGSEAGVLIVGREARERMPHFAKPRQYEFFIEEGSGLIRSNITILDPQVIGFTKVAGGKRDFLIVEGHGHDGGSIVGRWVYTTTERPFLEVVRGEEERVLVVSGERGRFYGLERSHDLVNWVEEGAVDSDGRIVLGAAGGVAFYRVKLVPN